MKSLNLNIFFLIFALIYFGICDDLKAQSLSMPESNTKGQTIFLHSPPFQNATATYQYPNPTEIGTAEVNRYSITDAGQGYIEQHTEARIESILGFAAGVAGIASTDIIRSQEFSVNKTGPYQLIIKGRTNGEVIEGSSASVNGVRKSGGEFWIMGGFKGENWESSDDELIYETDFSLNAYLEEAAWTALKVACEINCSPAGSELLNFFDEIIELFTPTITWDKTFELKRNMTLYQDLKYQWQVFSISSVGAGAVSVLEDLKELAYIKSQVQIESVELIYSAEINTEPDSCIVSVDPEIGNQDTEFHFIAMYYDQYGDLPISSELVVLGDPNSPYNLTKDNSSQNSYYLDTKLPIGNQIYYARFVNNENKLVQSDTKTIKVVNSENMTIDIVIHCDEEGEGLSLGYKKSGETRYTSINTSPEELFTVSIEPSSSIEFLANNQYDNYDFIKYKFTEPNGIVHESEGNWLNISFNDFASGIFKLDVYYEYTPQLYLLQGTITDIDGNPYTENVSLNLISSQQSKSLTVSNGTFSFNDIYGGIPVTITPELSTVGEILYPDAFYVGHLNQHYTTINFVVESGDFGFPDLELLEFPNDEVVSGQVEFAWNASDDITEDSQIHYRYYLTGYSNAWTEYSASKEASFSLMNGNYNFRVQAIDLAGNVNEVNHQFVVNSNPLIQVVEQEYGGPLSTRIKLYSQGSETSPKVYLLPKHSTNENEPLVPLRLFRLKEKKACGCLSEVTNSLELPTVFIDRGNCFEFIIPDTFPEENVLEYVIEWAYKATYGWSEKILLEDDFLNLEPNASYSSYIPTEVMDENLNMWRVAVRDRDMDRGKDAWAYIDMVNKDGIKIPARQIAFEKGYYYTDDDYLHHDFERARIYDFGDCKVVMLDEEVNQEQDGIKIVDIEYRYKMIHVNNQGYVLNSKTGPFHPDARLIFPLQKVNDAVWIFYTQNDDLYYEVHHKSTEQLYNYTQIFNTPEDHSIRYEEVFSSHEDKAFVILQHYWRTDLSERRSEILLKILNSDGSGPVQTVNLGLNLESDLVDFDDEYELLGSTVDNLGRLWMLINHDYDSDPEKHLLIVVDQSGNLIMTPTETILDDLRVCDKHGRIWAEDDDDDLIIVLDENFNSQSYSGSTAPRQRAGEYLVYYTSYDDYKVFDIESPYQFYINWDGQKYLDTCQIINTNARLNISHPVLYLNEENVFTSEEIIDSVLSFSLKDNIQNGLNVFSLEQSSLAGGEAVVAFPPEINIPPRISNRLDDIILNEDFGEYSVTTELDQIFYDEDTMEINVYGYDTLVDYSINQDELVLYSIENANGDGELYITANDGQFFEVDTLNYTILPINDPPVIEDQVFRVDENSAAETIIDTVWAEDPENDVLAFSIMSGNINNAIYLNTFTGELVVQNPNELDYETNPSFDLQVRVQDNGDGFLTDDATITINLNDLYETGINEMLGDGFKIYPNPVKEKLYIEFSSVTNDDLKISILDISGRVLMEKKLTYLKEGGITELNLKHLSSGIYYLFMESESQVYNWNFIVGN